MIVENAHGLSQEMMCVRKRRVIVFPKGSQQVVKSQSERRISRLSLRDLSGNVHVAPGCVGKNLVEKKVELVRVSVSARFVGRQDGHRGVGEIGVVGIAE